VWKIEKRREFGQNAGYWTVKNNYTNLLKESDCKELKDLHNYLCIDKTAFYILLFLVSIFFTSTKFPP
jgi:hypothetical protein